MFLIKSEAGVHGVDYTKGLEDGRHCGVNHPYVTKACRPVLYTEENYMYSKLEDRVDYDSLSDREKLELGEPIFFASPLFMALGKTGVRQVTEIAELDVQGRLIAKETRIRDEYENR
jgi:hypothetical protein